MNILFLDQFSDLGGAQRCLLDLQPALRDRGWKSYIAAPGDGPSLREMEAAPIRCGPYAAGHKTPGDVLRFALELPRLSREIAAIARRVQADLLYVNGPRLLPAAALSGVRPILFHCHSYLPQRYARWLAGAAVRRSGATVVASCWSVARPLARFVDPTRFHVVYTGLAPGLPVVPTGQRPAPPRVGTIGRVAPEKGQAEFLRAARMLGGFRFVVCGAPLFGDPAARRYADALPSIAEGLPVEFLGWRTDVSSVMAGLDLLVVPSAPHEGTTRVIFEAFAAGVPVLATRAGGIPEIVADGETGFLVDSRDPRVLADRIQALLSGPPEVLRGVAGRAQDAWRERYTLDLYQRNMLRILDHMSYSPGG